jgi:hypothetical protein
VRKILLAALGLVVLVMLYLDRGPNRAFAQEATLASPVPRTTVTKAKIRSFNVALNPANASVEVSLQDAGNVEVAVQPNVIPDPAHPGATVNGLATAMVTVRSGETGSDARKLQYRILGYLSDQGYLGASTILP